MKDISLVNWTYFGCAVRAKCFFDGIGPEQAAAAAGVSVKTVNRAIEYERLGRDTFNALCRWLGWSRYRLRTDYWDRVLRPVGKPELREAA